MEKLFDEKLKYRGKKSMKSMDFSYQYFKTLLGRGCRKQKELVTWGAVNKSQES